MEKSVQNMESDTTANIDSDHYPVIGTFTTKPRGISTMGSIEVDMKNAQRKKTTTPIKHSQKTHQTSSKNG